MAVGDGSWVRAIAVDAETGRVYVATDHAISILETEQAYQFFLPLLTKDQQPPSPPPSYAPAMAYDANRHVAVLYISPCTWDLPTHPTWEYDGASWYPVTTTHVPCLDRGYVMTYDRARGVTILAGLRGNYQGETWEYDGTDWTRISAIRPYPMRARGALAYDEGRERAVFFGGSWCERPGCVYFDKTFEYTGTDWTEVPALHRPAARSLPAMSHDPMRQITLLFGGWTANPGGGASTSLADTWEYDGLDWNLITPTHHPSERSGTAMVYDTSRGVVVLFGGLSDGGIFLNDTWEYDSLDWHPVSPPISPPPRSGHTMVYDASRGVIVLYGGHDGEPGHHFDDTWEYDGSNWRPRTGPGYRSPAP